MTGIASNNRTSGLWLLAAVLTFLASIGCGGTDSTSSGASPEPATDAQASTPTAETAPRGSSSITGVARFEGTAPSPPRIDMSADPACAAKHSETVYSDALALGEGNTLGWALVSVDSGLPEGDYAAPSEPVVLDQKGCHYTPHVVGIQVGQPFKILNSDGILHNVHSLSKVNSPFNRAMPGAVTETQFQFNREEAVFRVKCDVHPWMSAYVGVKRHPYFAVTAEDGRFEITGLPAGSYEISAWHEILGTQTTSVTVGDGDSQSVDFTFTR
jgi:plastocyanin